MNTKLNKDTKVVTRCNCRTGTFSLVAIMALQLSISSCSKDDAEKTTDSQGNPYISKIFEYVPAPGQFINTDLGNVAATSSLIGKARAGLVSLGGFGGYLIFGFDHSVKNQEGADIGIYGNPLTGINTEWSEPGIVMVMQDLNKNGLPDDGAWLELAGSEYSKTETVKNYKITYYNPKNLTDDIKWKDNQGKEGYILRNRFHAQEYYPQWIKEQNEVSFTGTLLKNTLKDGSILTNMPLEWGYADNGSEEYKTLMEATGAAYNKFDISWAVDQSGKKVQLNYIDFVKVYTAQNANGNPYDPDLTNAKARYLGEISTEIGGAIDIKLHQQNNK